MWAAQRTAALLAVAAVVASASPTYALPPRGFNAWFAWDVSLDESHMRNQSDAMVRLGLRDKGFLYVNLDGGWQGPRLPNGTITANSSKFPSGLNALAVYIHQNGQLFGGYTDRGRSTCDGSPGSQGFEVEDARSYASFEMDFVKSDSCGGDMSHSGAIAQYAVMQDALRATGRDMFYSLCGWLSWWPLASLSGVGSSWRIGPDALSWPNVLMNVDAAFSAAPFTGPNAFADVDEIMGPSRGRPINAAQTRTQYCFIALIGSPLLLSFDLSSLSADDPDVAPYLNDEILAVHWDANPRGPRFDRVVGGAVGVDKLPLLTRQLCNASNPAVQWRFTPTVNSSTGYLESLGAGLCMQAGPSWDAMFNNAQGVWAGACHPAMCGDSACTNQVFHIDSATGLITSLYWPESNIAAGPYLTLDPVPNALYLNERYTGSTMFKDAGAQAWAFDAVTGLLKNTASSTCVGAVARDTKNVWSKELAEAGSAALLLINVGPDSQAVTCDAACFAAAGLSSTATFLVRDLWMRTDNGTTTAGAGLSFDLPPGGSSVFVRLTPQ